MKYNYSYVKTQRTATKNKHQKQCEQLHSDTFEHLKKANCTISKTQLEISTPKLQ